MNFDLSIIKMASGCAKLPYRYLGNSGLKVSALCLGAMTFGQREVRNEPTVRSKLAVRYKLVGVVAMPLSCQGRGSRVRHLEDHLVPGSRFMIVEK